MIQVSKGQDISNAVGTERCKAGGMLPAGCFSQQRNTAGLRPRTSLAPGTGMKLLDIERTITFRPCSLFPQPPAQRLFSRFTSVKARMWAVNWVGPSTTPSHAGPAQQRNYATTQLRNRGPATYQAVDYCYESSGVAGLDLRSIGRKPPILSCDPVSSRMHWCPPCAQADNMPRHTDASGTLTRMPLNAERPTLAANDEERLHRERKNLRTCSQPLQQASKKGPVTST